MEIWEWGIHAWFKWVGHLQFNYWVGHLWLKWAGKFYVQQSKVLFIFEEYAQKSAGQGSTLSGHRMTTGFDPFELPTCGLLQGGWDHFPPKACFEEPSSRLASMVL